jgi:DNA-binding MarR family transcriptional regulator
MSDDALLRFADATHQDLARLLLAASRSVNAQALAAIDPDGTSGVRPAHVPVIASLDADGTRLVTIAARLDISRQGVAGLVRDLTAAGVVTVAPDPADARAQRVTLTPKGADFCTRAADYLEQREREWRHEHGERTLAIVRDFLTRLADTPDPA